MVPAYYWLGWGIKGNRELYAYDYVKQMALEGLDPNDPFGYNTGVSTRDYRILVNASAYNGVNRVQFSVVLLPLAIGNAPNS